MVSGVGKIRKHKILLSITIFISLIFLNQLSILLDSIDFKPDISFRRSRITSESTWPMALPEEEFLVFKGVDEIYQYLEASGDNWYWDVLTPESKQEIMQRILALQNLPDFVEAHYGHKYNIISIIVKRSFLWGFNNEQRLFLSDNPYDLDITVIVEGDIIGSDHRALTPDEVVELFGENAFRWTNRMDIKFLGDEFILNYFSDYDANIADSYQGFEADLRAISDRGSGINIAGPNWFSERPPDIVWFRAIESMLEEARDLFENFLMLNGEHYFSSDVQERYRELGLKSSTDAGLTIAEDREYRRLEDNIHKLQFVYNKAMKRLIEGNLRLHYFLTHRRPELHDTILTQVDLSEDNPFVCHNMIETANEIISVGMTQDFYNRIFSEDGIIYFMEALDILRSSLDNLIQINGQSSLL
jgi:hypothetical protein